MSTWRFKHESDLPRRSPLRNISNKGPKPNHLYEKVVNHRKNNVEQISNRIVMNHGMIVMEDLSVKGLRSISKDRRMTQNYNDASVGILRKRICNKAESAVARSSSWIPKERHIYVPTAKRWSIRISIREHICPHYRYRENRDVNVARNILSRALSTSQQGQRGGPATLSDI